MRLHKMTLVKLCGILFIFLAACSSGNVGGSDEAQNGGTSNEAMDSGDESNLTDSQDAEGVQVNPNATPEMDFDLGGRTIKLVSWYDESIKEDSPDSIQMKENLDALMEKHNFTVEYVVVDYGEYRDKVTASLIAGEPLGDIIRLARPWMIPTLTSQDLFWPVDEYVKNDNAFVLQYTDEFSQYEDRGYGFRIGINGAASGVIYNRTLMNELGIEPLQQYVDQDNWNWDTFMQIAKEANRDTDNDGQLDRWGLATDSLLIQALASNEANLVTEGKVMFDDPNTLEALNFISTLATERIARPTEGGDWTEPKQFFLEGNVLMFASHDYEMENLRQDMPENDLGFLPFPKGPKATGYHSHNTIPNYYTIPKSVDNPELLVYIWEKIHDIESIYDYPHQASFEKYFTTEEDIHNAQLAVESMKVIEQIDYYPNMPYYEFVDELLNGVSVSTLIETYQAPFQAAVDEVWKP